MKGLEYKYGADIEQIAQKFPYSLPFQALRAKLNKDHEKIDYEKFVKISAMLAPDRLWLYNFIHTSSKSLEQTSKPIDTPVLEITQEAAKQVVPQNEQTVSLTEHVVKHVVPVEIKQDEPVVNIELSDPQVITEKPVLVESFDDKLTSLALKEVKNTEIVPDKALVVDVKIDEDQIVVDQSSVTEREKIVLPVDSVSHKSHEHTSSESKLNATFLEKEILNVAIDKSIQKEVLEQEISEEEQGSEEENQLQSGDDSAFGYWLNPSKVKQASREEKLKRIDQLIERFIKNEPKIVPKKVEFYSPVNVAKQSVAFDEDLVSEPLASIFEKQGYFDKAIKAYEKLSLKFPEKRIYFAGRIEKIKEIIKNIKNTK